MLVIGYIYIYMSNRFFENQPNQICSSHLSEKASKGRFHKHENNEEKGKEKKKELGEEKKQWLHSQFLQWLLWR